MAERKKAISRYRSPQTTADEIYRILIWGVQPLLMVFCIALSFSSYQAFFGHNFSPLMATAGAVILSLVIELGKIKIGGYVFQTPFLSGTRVLASSFAAFSVWFGALLITAATFTMSVINSTSGAQLLALKTGYEKNNTEFRPNTTEIDAQIAQTNARISDANAVKWKGTVTYQSQQAIKSLSTTLSGLTKQREKSVASQREDFERQRAHSDETTSTGADMIMAAGGWVELLQLITLFLIAACMATIDSVMGQNGHQHSPTSAKSNPQTGFHHTPNGAHNQTPTGIGFYWPGYGGSPAAQPPPPVAGVSHQPYGVTHQQSADGILRLARKDFGSWAANLDSRKHNPDTCSQHIDRILGELLAQMDNPDFLPSTTEAIKSWDYFSRKLAELDQKGRPFGEKYCLLERLKSFAFAQNATQ